MYKLFGFKQKLLGRTNEKAGIKWHMILHLPLYIRLFGPAAVFDMVKYEKYHSIVKVMFDQTSKRFGTTNDEIMNRVVFNKAIKGAMPEDPSQMRNRAREEEDDLSTHNDLAYNTEGNIIFSTILGDNNREKIIFQGGRFLLPEDPAFINPIADGIIFGNTMRGYMEYLREGNVQLEGRNYIFFFNIYVDCFCNYIVLSAGKSLLRLFAYATQERPGYGLFSVRTVKFDGGPQGMPITHFYTDKYHGLTSGVTSDTTSRFDWFWTRDGGYMQLLALVQLCYPVHRHGKIVTKSVYFHVSADTEKLIKRKYPTVDGRRYVLIHSFHVIT